MPACGTAWHQLSHGTARKGLQPALGSAAGTLRPRSPYQGSWGPANTGGHEYWWPEQGWGRDRPRSRAGEEGRWAESLAHCRTPSIFAQKRENEPGTSPRYRSLPLQPGAGGCNHSVPVRGARHDPKTQGFGGCKRLALHGCLSQRWLRERGPGDGGVPQGAEAMSPFDSSRCCWRSQGLRECCPPKN